MRGVFVHPSQTDELMSRYPEVVNYQVVITGEKRGDEMTFHVELEKENIDKERLKHQLQDAIKEALKLRCKVEFIPKGSIREDAKTIEDRRDWGSIGKDLGKL